MQILSTPKKTIKSIQRGTVTFNTNSLNVTIPNVDPSKCRVKLNWRATSYNGQVDPRGEVRGRVTGATTLNLECFTYAYDKTVEYTITEFKNVKSVQTGVYAGSSSLITITIPTVDPNKSDLDFTKYCASSQYGDSKTLITGKIKTATSLEFQSVASTDINPSYSVVEY